jgi:hypothetical protein
MISVALKKNHPDRMKIRAREGKGCNEYLATSLWLGPTMYFMVPYATWEVVNCIQYFKWICVRFKL